ncbi:hypothetical protein KCV07_g5926, partial [Aureobasidium melanogenum]
MNASSISVRKAFAHTTAALKTVAFEAVALDAARRRADNACRRSERKTKKAMLLVKKVVKILKTERKANKAKNKDCHSPELEEKELDVLLQRYRALGDEYLEKKKKLGALTDPVRVKHALSIALDTSILTM